MAYTYLVTVKATGGMKLVEASSPANAVAAVAKTEYETQRVEGPVLAALKASVGEPIKASGKDDAAQTEDTDEGTPDTSSGSNKPKDAPKAN